VVQGFDNPEYAKSRRKMKKAHREPRQVLCAPLKINFMLPALPLDALVCCFIVTVKYKKKHLCQAVFAGRS